MVALLGVVGVEAEEVDRLLALEVDEHEVLAPGDAPAPRHPRLDDGVLDDGARAGGHVGVLRGHQEDLGQGWAGRIDGVGGEDQLPRPGHPLGNPGRRADRSIPRSGTSGRGFWGRLQASTASVMHGRPRGRPLEGVS